MLEAYLDAPASVPNEWRELFERDPEAVADSLPGLVGLLGRDRPNGAATAMPSRQRRLPLRRRPLQEPPSPRDRPRRRPALVPPEAAVVPAPARCARPGSVRPPRHRPRRRPAQPPAQPEHRPGVRGYRRATGDRRRHAPRRRGRGDGARQGLPDARAPRRQARPARLRADGRPGAGRVTARAVAHTRAPVADPGFAPPPLRRGRHPARGAAAPPGRSTRARSPTRSSTSPTTPSASGCGRRSSRGASGSRSTPRSDESLLHRLSQAEGFEQYLRRSFLGQKQFSLEGLESLVPMLDETISLAAAGGAHEVVIGMAHRGRLNALVHTVGRSYQSILREFEGERSIDALVVDPEGGTGDVKYHLPASGTRVTPAGEIDVTIVPNPSHLEAADPVVEGRARAEQTDRSTGAGIHDPSVALPVLIHGDAAFPGQGVVAETLNLQSLEGYATGGTLHLITNNQVGYTTDPTESRSTRYSSDLAKGFDVPIVHVNADDPEAALSAVRLALAYRTEFGHDFVIDLVGYRRFGHNEQDDASYTQPLMVERIQKQPTVRAVYASRLVEEGVISAKAVEAFVADVTATLRAAHEQLRTAIGHAPPPAASEDHPGGDDGRRGRHRGGRRSPARTERAAAGGAGGLHDQCEAREAARAAPRDDRRGRHRLGSGRGARVRLPARGRHSRSALGSGHRTRHVRPPPSHVPRPVHRRDVRADPAPPRGGRVLRGLQLAAVGIRGARLRVRLLGGRARRARALGGAIRRFRQRRPDRDRPVPRRRPLEVGPDLPAHAPAAARLRG